MTLHEQVTDILASAVEAQECAGISVLVRRCGEEMLYTQAGMSDIASGRLIHRDSIFRLYSQSRSPDGIFPLSHNSESEMQAYP